MDCRFTITNVPPPAVLTWIQEAAQGLGSQRSIKLIEADLNFNKVAALSLTGAFIKRVSLPVLDAATKSAVAFEITVVSDTVARAPASGKVTPPVIKPKIMLASNFRVTAGATVLPRVGEVSSLAFDVAVLPPAGKLGRHPGAVSVPPVVLSAATNETGLRPWAADAADGKGARPMVIDFVAIDQTTKIMSWTTLDATPLGDVSPFGLGTAIDAPARIELEVQGNGATIVAAP